MICGWGGEGSESRESAQPEMYVAYSCWCTAELDQREQFTSTPQKIHRCRAGCADIEVYFGNVAASPLT